MSFLLLLIWQCLFILRPLDWPMFAVQMELPVVPLTLITAVAFLILFQREKKILSTQLYILCAFMVTIVVSAFLNGWLGGGVISVQDFFLTAFIPFILYSAHSISIRKQQVLLFSLLVSGLLMVSNGMSQMQSIDGVGWAGARSFQLTRITFLGRLGDPNDLGGYFVMCIPFAAYFYRHSSLIIMRLFGLFCMAALGYGIYLTNSRGALLSGLGLTGAYIYYRFGLKKAVFVAMALLPVAALIVSRFRAVEMDSSAYDRVDIWFEGMQMWEQNPVFGIGMHNFYDYAGLTAHNSFLLVMSELGTIGYLLWLGLLLVSFVLSLHLVSHYRKLLAENGFRKLESSELNESLAVNSALFFSFIGFFISAFFLSRTYSVFPYMLCAFLAGSYLRIIRINPELRFKKFDKFFKYTLTGGIFSILGMYTLIRVLLLST